MARCSSVRAVSGRRRTTRESQRLTDEVRCRDAEGVYLTEAVKDAIRVIDWPAVAW